MSELVEEINEKKKYLPKKLKELFSAEVRVTLTSALDYESKEEQLHKILQTIMNIARRNKFRRY